ncbi:hypothetical protein RCL1_006147 [Eukaryota sp. TZLM3-RCL]
MLQHISIPDPYRGVFKHKLVNRHSTTLSFARNLCEQLRFLHHWSTSRTERNPFINAIIGTRGSGKTTFGCGFPQLLLDSPDLVSVFRESVHACNLDPRFVDLLLYLFLSGRWLGVELPTPDAMRCSAEDYFLNYVEVFFGVKRETTSTPVPFIPQLRSLLSRVVPKTVNHEACCFRSDAEALSFYQESTNSTSPLPFLFFCDEVSGSTSTIDPNSNQVNGMIRDFVPVFKKIVRESVGLVYTAGLYWRYFQNRLVNAKFDVVYYRLTAITDLNHLKQFLDNDEELQAIGYDEFEALSFLIRCSGNPRLIVNVIDDYKKTSTWTINVSSSAISSDPVYQALAIAAVPLLLSCSHGGKADVLDLPTESQSLDILELQSNLMLHPLVTPPPRHLRKNLKFEATRYHCILNTFDFDNTILRSDCLNDEICSAFQNVIQEQVTLFTQRRSLTNYSEFAGENAEYLVLYLLLMRNYLVQRYVKFTSNEKKLPLAYLFGPSHTEPVPDYALWIHRDYAIELSKSLNFVQLKTAVKPNSSTFNFDEYRGRICKNIEKAHGPDIILFPKNGNILIGVDCKVKMKNVDKDAAKEFAKQFILGLACQLPVPVLFSVRCTNDASDVFLIRQQLTYSIYEQAFNELKLKHPSCILDVSYRSLLERVELTTGVRPVHELCGNQFFGPILGSILKTYYDSSTDTPPTTLHRKCSIL